MAIVGRSRAGLILPRVDALRCGLCRQCRPDHCDGIIVRDVERAHLLGKRGRGALGCLARGIALWGYETAVAASGFDESGCLKLAVRPSYRVRGDAEFIGEATHGREPGARPELSRLHLLDDAGAELFERGDGGVRVNGKWHAPIRSSDNEMWQYNRDAVAVRARRCPGAGLAT